MDWSGVASRLRERIRDARSPCAIGPTVIALGSGALAVCGESPTAVSVPTEVVPFATGDSTVLDGLLYQVTTAVLDSDPGELGMAVRATSVRLARARALSGRVHQA
jgi:hypothetical protein